MVALSGARTAINDPALTTNGATLAARIAPMNPRLFIMPILPQGRLHCNRRIAYMLHPTRLMFLGARKPE